MKNYEIFKSEYEKDDIIVLVFNERDMLSVQKQVVEMGYTITQRINENYFRAYKFKEA